jgi:hypothetical protein
MKGRNEKKLREIKRDKERGQYKEIEKESKGERGREREREEE